VLHFFITRRVLILAALKENAQVKFTPVQTSFLALKILSGLTTDMQ